MNHLLLKKRLNNQKNKRIKGKITKSHTTFSESKPNSPIVQTNLTSFTTMNYPIFASLTKVKNKPNQTQYKPNTKPIYINAIINLSSFVTSKYKKVSSQRGKKTNPKQSQNKPKVTNLSPRDNQSSFYPQGIIDNKLRRQTQFKFILECLSREHNFKGKQSVENSTVNPAGISGRTQAVIPVQKLLHSFSSAVIVNSEFIRYQHKVFYNVMFRIKGAVK